MMGYSNGIAAAHRNGVSNLVPNAIFPQAIDELRSAIRQEEEREQLIRNQIKKLPPANIHRKNKPVQPGQDENNHNRERLFAFCLCCRVFYVQQNTF